MRIQCNSCSANLKASPAHAGRKVKCPKCNTSLLIPPAVAIEAASEGEDESVAMAETRLSQMLKRANEQQLAGGSIETPETQTPVVSRTTLPAPAIATTNSGPPTVSALESEPPTVKPIESQPPLVKAVPTPPTVKAIPPTVKAIPPTSPPLVKPASKVAPASAKTLEEPTKSYAQVRAEVLSNFQGKIPQNRVPMSYKLSVLLVTIVMVLIPMIYIGIIIATAMVVYWHAVNNVEILQARGVRGKGYLIVLAVYAAPIVVGAIMVLFMTKPLFAPRAKEGRRRSLTRDGEPLLFDFVDRICETVGSSRPSRIDIDCQVNASAGFRRGFLSFLGNDLVLTIGMPLVAGMNMRQFGGVLAHEFGHFSQGVGMRLSYLIRTIAGWLHRVVYQRDAWDEWLSASAGSIDIRVGFILYLAMFFVWLSRKILWLLMMVGFGVSGVLLRQMEFDADRYEARLSGSDTFEKTSKQITLLSIAYSGAQSDMSHFYSEGRLADSLPKLIQANVKQLPKKAYQFVDESIEKEKTGIFDTHPCTKARIENARRENAPGVFTLELPASLLFQHYDAAAKNVTWDFYCAIFEKNIEQKDLHSTDKLLETQTKETEAGGSLNRFFQGQFRFDQSLPQIEPIQISSENIRAIPAQIRDTRDAMLQGLAKQEVRRKKMTDAVGKLIQATQVVHLNAAGVRPNAKDYEIPVENKLSKLEYDKAELAIQKLRPAITAWESIVMERLSLNLSLLSVAPIYAKIEDGEAVSRETQRLVPIANRLLACAKKRTQLQIEFGKVTCMLNYFDAKRTDQTFIGRLLDQLGVVCDQANELRFSFKDVPYPMQHAQGDITVATFLLTEPLLDRQNLDQILSSAANITERLGTLTYRVLSQLTASAEKVEQRIGLEPLPEVKGDDDDNPDAVGS